MLVLGLSEISATEVTVALANFSNTVADDSSTSKAELTVFEFSPADTDVEELTETEARADPGEGPGGPWPPPIGIILFF